MSRSQSFAISAARTRWGRAALHAFCLFRRRNFHWHLSGIGRELFGWGRSANGAANSKMTRAGDPLFTGMVLLQVGIALGGNASANHSDLALVPAAQVDSAGIFLHQIVAGIPSSHPVRLADAPKFGQAKVFTRGEVMDLWRAAAPGLSVKDAWSGANSTRIFRKSRMFTEAELKPLLTTTLQSQIVKERGELELRLARPWAAIRAPDETLVLKLLDVPATGVSGHFIVRFEIVAGEETVGSWQVVCQARVLKDVLVAKSTVRRGQTLAESDLVVERRDVLPLRDPVEFSLRDSPALELTENVTSGFPILTRSVRLRPVVQRGQFVDGIVLEGGLHISLKVEVLADAVTGQMVRVRNPRTRKEFHAKVQNEQTVVIVL